MRVILNYEFENKKSFLDKVLPYVYGGGIYSREDFPNKIKKKSAELKTNFRNLSQLITASTGMLRYSKGCILKDVDVIDKDNKSKKDFNFSSIIFGIILKPSLEYDRKVLMKIINASVQCKVDFVKDDDASNYSKKEAKEIKRSMKNIPYFQNITDTKDIVSKYVMVTPWVNGWNLLEKTSHKYLTISHCANLSSQISWESQIIFSRLAGASLIIVPDFLFDRTFNLKKCIESAKKEMGGVGKAKIILSGGINPERIREILDKVKKEDYKYLGFAVGSWILSYSLDIKSNILKLKQSIK